jgi:hypothetical protein
MGGLISLQDAQTTRGVEDECTVYIKGFLSQDEGTVLGFGQDFTLFPFDTL